MKVDVLPGLLIALSLAKTVSCQSSSCGVPKIFTALQQNVVNGSDSFCQEFIASVSYIGTLREDPTYFFYATVTDPKSTETVYKVKSITTKEVVTRTSYTSQSRQAKNFTKPLPSYVQQYQSAKVSQGCSCLIGSGPTYTQYRVCEQATTSTRFSTTFTYTVGKPGTKTVTFTETSTQLKLKSTTAPYPTTCPDAEGIDYVATDHTLWERACKTYLGCYRELDTIKAPSFTACIEKCVDYNQKAGFKKCQAVSYVPKSNDCLRVNEPCYFAHPDGAANVALLKFLPDPTKSVTDYCATVSGAG